MSVVVKWLAFIRGEMRPKNVFVMGVLCSEMIANVFFTAKHVEKRCSKQGKNRT